MDHYWWSHNLQREIKVRRNPSDHDSIIVMHPLIIHNTLWSQTKEACSEFYRYLCYYHILRSLAINDTILHTLGFLRDIARREPGRKLWIGVHWARIRDGVTNCPVLGLGHLSFITFSTDSLTRYDRAWYLWIRYIALSMKLKQSCFAQ